MTYRLEFIMKGSGFFVNETAGEALGEHKLVYRAVSGNWMLADADAAATMPVLGITMSVIPLGRRGRILRQGYIGDLTWVWTIGDEIYASTTAGELTQTAPVGVGDIVQIVGAATDVNMIYFNSDLGSGGGTAWVDGFWPAVDPNSNKGTYPSIFMSDEVEATIRQTFVIPDDIVTIDRAAVIIIPDASGNLYWSCSTNFGQLCANEDYQTHTDSIALNATAVTLDEIECIDISAALTGATGGDLVGMEFVRDATNVLDTIDDIVHYIGIIIQGSI